MVRLQCDSDKIETKFDAPLEGYTSGSAIGYLVAMARPGGKVQVCPLARFPNLDETRLIQSKAGQDIVGLALGDSTPALLLLAMAGDQGAVEVWKLKENSKDLEQQLLSITSRSGFALSMKNRKLAWVDENGRVIITNLLNGQAVAEFTPEGRPAPSTNPGQATPRARTPQRVRSVAFSPDSKLLAVGGSTPGAEPSQAGEVALFDPTTQRLLGSLKLAAEVEGDVWDLAFHPDGQQVALACNDGAIKLVSWQDVGSKIQMQAKRLAPHSDSGRVRSVAFSRKGETVASGGADWNVRIWKTATDLKEDFTANHQGEVNSVCFSPDGTRLASASADTKVRIWDLATRKVNLVLDHHKGEVNRVAFSPDGSLLASAGQDGKLHLWDAGTGKLVHTLADHPQGALSLAFSPDGKRLATGGGDRLVRLWDVQTGQEVLALKAPSNLDRGLAFSPDGRFLAAATANGHIVWEAPEPPTP
jgi:WD40 repeat protein